MSGEVKASQRPKNSLLAEDLDFENAGKVTPLITEQITKSLEDIIKGRIIEKAFDDPIRKVVDKKKVCVIPVLSQWFGAFSGGRRTRLCEFCDSSANPSLLSLLEM